VFERPPVIGRSAASASQEHAVDFSSSYDINSHSNVCIEAIALNDEMFNTHGRFEEQVLDVVDFGRRFTLGVHAKSSPAEVRCRGRPHGVAAPFSMLQERNRSCYRIASVHILGAIKIALPWMCRRISAGTK